MRRVRVGIGMIGVLLALGYPRQVAAAAARLEYRGTVLTSSQVHALAAPALRAPRDSAAVSGALGALVARLQDLGYLDARAQASLDTTSGPLLRLAVAEGPRYAITRLRIEAPAGPDSGLFAAALELAFGAWASPSAVREAVEGAVRRIADQGHPYAQLGVSGWETDSSGARVTLTGALGPDVRISRVRIEGLRVTRERLASRAMGRLTELPYHRATALAARDRLEQLGLFRQVSFEGLEGEGDWARAHLVYRVEELRYNQFEGVIGFQGDAGTVGLARLDLGNILGTGRAVGLRWEARGRGVSSFSARIAEPLVLGTPLRIEGTLDQLVQDTLYTRSRWGLRGHFALSAEERVEAGYEQEHVVQEHGVLEQAKLQNTLFALERSTLDDPLGPRHGSRVRLEASQTFKREVLRPTGTRSARAGAVGLRSQWNHPLSRWTGVSLELTTAGRFSSQRVLPLFERYALGGAASLRGFDEEAFRVDRYALSRLEWRRFIGAHGQRAFLFWDHAWMGTREAQPGGGDRLAQLQRNGVGFGLRLEAAGGLVGIDYGLETGRAPLEGKIHLQLISNF